ncbi:unnamed protein product [Onchocerca ochengi]|uniref:Serine/threonine-protein phosphatase n=1 Tax=Onchocerca ochengi TaxID=42157 RepID=A0A182E070_ONCOC|nr:unnamed protein product [Onchocerca ochengi]
MAVMGLAFFTTYMSDALISGFTTGSAFHVFIAQLNKIIGVKLSRHSGFGMLFFMMHDLMLALPQTNCWALGISVSSIIFLSLGRNYINPWFKKRSPVPLPIELILVILVTIFSSYMNLKNNYDVKIVDYIPQGIPTQSLPNFDLVPYLLSDALAIAIISYMFVISMAKLFAKKRHYTIDPTQDLYAVGLMHILSSFFPIFPAGGSLSRSAVCEQSGANTQLHIFFSNLLLLIVIAFIGPLLESLPMAVWLVCCVATVSFDVITGLMISVLFTLFSVVLREQWLNTFVMGRTVHREIYKPLAYYPDLKPVNENIEIIRFEAPLNFVTVSAFLGKMSEVLRSDANQDYELQSMKNNQIIVPKTVTQPNYEELSQKEAMVAKSTKQQQSWYEIASPGIVIIDCGAISNIDTMGVEAIKETYLQGKEVNKTVLFADISETILDAFERIDFYSSVPKTSFYPSLEEAIRTTTNDIVAEEELHRVCQKAKEAFINQSSLIEVDPPLVVCGDIHGQYSDLLRIYDRNGFPPESNYLFLGDFVDRGKQNIETICLQFCYKIKYPENFFMLRGNHETPAINRVYGFFEECNRRYHSTRLWNAFQDTFNWMPFCGYIGGRILCMHGGLSPHLNNFDQLRNLPRPIDPPNPSMEIDLLWSDPDQWVKGWQANTRGASYTFGQDVVVDVCQKLDLDLIARAHQVVQDGYEFFANRRLVTIFSAPHYCGQFDNAGGTMTVSEDMNCSFQIFRPASKAVRMAMKAAGTL